MAAIRAGIVASIAAWMAGLGFGLRCDAGSGVGEAFGISASVGGVVVTKTPYVVLPPDGSKTPVQAELASFNEPGIASATTTAVSTQGRITGNNGTIFSSAQLEEVNVLDGLITADLVVAQTSSGEHTDQGNQKSARISSGGATFSGLVVAGLAFENEPPPNTEIPISGVGVVILNEQIEAGDNLTHSSLTVNAVHVILLDGLVPVGEIIVSSAHSGVDYRR
jgi:hypothetical protein